MGNIFGILEGKTNPNFCEKIYTKESETTEFVKTDLLSNLYEREENFKKLFNLYFEKNFKINSSYSISIKKNIDINPITHSSLFLAIFCSAI